ncbi:cytochrome-c oxidase, cbb3-type subunit III [Neoroseomonas oryzicola]|uniref:Cbb3-type cytochrome c oxidase subunit n=1 Tax=Neoroseomonas oryzicola TaxID=535904 RepID=A0A9X9WN90_9PROT|nr:cytochrome-c oxidase, cbb3-type subunit III [Neoroseomonas oryzicola]MBR0661800.1 cytochrome-c oxidase, cbb3-type subunit III [Neoroseomonas oryzicola]NKE17092.1 cytochrome-c oxidase, cbb3-type subunit III [Neoroseomonas oryzicola]
MPTKIEKDTVSGQDTTGHEWDGLKELNTPLPKWWLYTFYATIVWALVWVVVYPSVPFWRGTSGWIAREAIVGEVEAANARNAPMMARLREATPAQIAADPEMRAFALAGGRVAFANNCAGCHGAGGQGAQGGYPTLADDDWIWGGSLEAIQQTIRHGIRNTEDDEARTSIMPRFGADGMLTAAQIGDVAEHVLSLSGRATDQAAAGRGQAIFAEQCVACHGDRGEGNRDVGAPRLSDQVWLYGNTKAQIMAIINNPRMGVMPAWQGRLDPAVINMLTVYVHSLGGGE